MEITEQFRDLLPPSFIAAAPMEQKNPKDYKDLFLKESFELLEAIERLQGYLRDHKVAYCKLPGVHGSFSEGEKDEIDRHTGFLVKTCLDRVADLEKKIESNGGDDQIIRNHRVSIIWLLNQKVLETSRVHKDMQQIRQSNVQKKDSSVLSKAQKNTLENNSLESKVLMLPEDYQRNGNGQGGIEINLRETSEQDQLLLEEENRNLFEEYNNLIDQLRETETKVLEISELQGFLEYHVMLQAKEIENLYDESLASVEKVKQGNDQLNKAKDHSSSFRKYVILFMLLCTLILWFLDWYD